MTTRLAVLLLGLWPPADADAGTNLTLFASPASPSSVARSGAGMGTVAGKVYLWSGYAGNPRTLRAEVYDPANGLWTSVANCPSGRDYMSTFALDGRLYSVAGEGPGSGSFSKSVYRYDPQTDQWTTLNNFPVTSWMAMAAVCGGRAYLIGGRPGYGKTVADVYEYNEAADSWTARAPMPVPVMLAGAASHGGKVYVFGGNFKTDEAHNLHTNAVQVFDPAADTWTRLPSMPAVLLAPVAAVTQGDAIYVFAKLAWDAGSSTWVSNPSVYRYAPASGGWCALDFATPDPVWYNQRPVNLDGVVYLTADDNTTNSTYQVALPVVEATPVAASSIARSGAGTGTVAGKVYLWSGYSGNPRTLQTEVYDPANGLWSSVANFPSGRDYMSTFALDGRLYSVAGEGPGSGSFSKSVYRYDPQTSRWTTLNNFPVTSWMAMAAVCGGRAYLIGGRPGYGKTVADVYEYNEAADSWTARAPMPVPVMLAGAASHGGKVYVFGGNFKTDEAHNLHTNTVQVFDPVADTWTRLPDMPAVLLAPVAAVTQGEAIYVFAKLAWDAGSSTWVPNPSVYRYAPASGGWCALDYSTPEPVWYNQRPANLGGVIYLTADDNTTNTVYRVDLPEPPELAVQPVHQTTSPGGSVTFNVSASGYPPRSYQWFFNGNPIAGANGARLSLTSVQTAQVGSYTCTVSTPFGSITSMPATLGLIGLDFIARVTLTGPIGTKYEVQYRLALPEGEWLRLTNVTLTAISQEFIDWGSPGHPYRFYRAIPLP